MMNRMRRLPRSLRVAWSSTVKSNANIDFERELILYGGKKQTPVSLKSLMDTGKGSLLSEFEVIKGNQIQTSTASELVLFQIASFLHRELPVRIAHRVEHLQSAPYLQNNGTFFNDLRTFTLLVLHSTLGCAASIQKVCGWYKNSFAKLRSAPAPTTPEKREEFTKVLQSIYDVHSSTLVYIAKGLTDFRTSLNQSVHEFADHAEIQKMFDEFILGRIGIRMVREIIGSDLLAYH
jgi:pyruvate dehydrogenase kinase 2/3/4